MAERHIAVCDECGKTEDLLVQASVSSSFTTGNFSLDTAYTFSDPPGWRRVNGRLLCSWACVATYAAKQAEAGAKR